jgi:UDP-glucuronate 4-epimerase
LNIIITGAAGFIGFNLAQYILKKYKHINIFGIDNINNYYSTKIKINRLNILKKNKQFFFIKKNINSISKIKQIKNKKIECIINLAAQAGVRYSIENPKKYLETNIHGFFEILEYCKNNKVKKLIYASSSSVYGDQKKFPLTEQQNIKPLNFYGFSKKSNEEMAEIYSKLYNVKSIGLRFFSIYGEWGRPDMFFMKYLKYLFFKKPKFYLYNYGNHYRDFTYIKDVVLIIKKLVNLKQREKHLIYNVCSNKPIKITKVISIIEQYTKKKIEIGKTNFQVADILKTHGDNKKIKKITKLTKFTDINLGIKNLINWFLRYNKLTKVS